VGDEMLTVEEQLCAFLEENKQSFLKTWRENVMISEEDIHKQNVSVNGLTMLQLVIQMLRSPLNEDQIKTLAYRVASERVESNVNIGEFVYNVNLGRSEIFKHLYDSNIPLSDLQPTINKINICFDQFLYHAVLKYTELKNNDLEAKQTFIDQTHKERLTILGQMSSSFVHEFRNPLTAVKGFVKLLQAENPDLKYLNIIDHELEQLNFRISQFLLVSKKDMIGNVKETFLVCDLFEETLEFLYPSIVDGEVEVISNVDQTISMYGYREEIRQVFINIIINSIDALQNKGQNRQIIIDVEQREGNVVIQISNNGPKIPVSSLNTIFEPFVTTKKLGTGIGLFICKQIIEKHHGTIFGESNDSKTIFSIHIPKSEKEKLKNQV
jgi:signal transduction histidine kinase